MDSTGPQPWRMGPRATWLFDLAVVGVLLFGGFVYLAVVRETYAAVLTLAEITPLVIRRYRPGTTFSLVAGVHAVQALTYDYPLWGQIAFPIAVYSLARFGRPRDGWIGLGVSTVAAVVASVVWTRAFHAELSPDLADPLTVKDYFPYIASIGAIIVAAWALGTQARIRRAYEDTLVERGQQLAAEAEQRAVMTAADERARIAREMHDVVAHGLSVVIVQADGARYAAEQDPGVAVRTLETIAGTGREALAEMRRLLGLLRGSQDPALVPQPGLADLPTLLSADPGHIVSDLPDPLPTVPDGVALTAYRVVQESLTNVRKHAGPDARSTVRLWIDGADLMVEVTDDGYGAAATVETSGLGLLGMRERVQVHGGSVHAGPAPGGGWTVRARIPT